MKMRAVPGLLKRINEREVLETIREQAAAKGIVY